VKILPKKEFIERVIKRGLEKGLPEEKAVEEALSTEAIHLDPEGEILVQRGAPLGIRLHEIGHKVLGHTDIYSDIETGDRTIGDEIFDEILAEQYSYDTRGKEPTYRLAIPAINMLMWKYKWSPESAVFWSLKILKDKLGIVPTRLERRELARHARGFHRRPR